MASFNFEGLWTLMSQYSFEVNPACFDKGLMCVICKKLLIDACQSLCGCRYCNKCIINYVGDGKKLCPGDGIRCSEEYVDLDADLVKDRRSNNKIYKLQVKCPHKLCEDFIELSEMSEHLRVCSKETVKCPYVFMGCDEESVVKENIMSHVNKATFEHSYLLMEWAQSLQNEVHLLRSSVESCNCENMSLRMELREKDQKIHTLELKINEGLEQRNIIRSETENESIIDEVIVQGNTRAIGMMQECPSVRRSIDADFVWTLKNCSANVGPNRYSDGFYSHGYKLCLCFFIYGDSVGLNCVIMPGENDDKLSWPMMKTVTLSIIDQDTMGPYKTSSFHYDTYNNKSVFFRPKNDRSHYVGANPFVLYSTIKELVHVIVNDTLIVTCVINDL